MSDILHLSHKSTLLAAHQQTLRRQVIDENGPGTILRDFEKLVNFIGAEGIQVTGQYYYGDDE